MNRSDTNAMLTQLAEEKVIGKDIANLMRVDALDTTKDIDFTPYYHGSTFVPLVLMES